MKKSAVLFLTAMFALTGCTNSVPDNDITPGLKSSSSQAHINEAGEKIGELASGIKQTAEDLVEKSQEWAEKNDVKGKLSDFAQSMKKGYERAESQGAGNQGFAYNRRYFGSWADLDGNGCDTRSDILKRDLMNVQNNGCKVLSGTLVDPYSGQTLELNSKKDVQRKVQIDHIVPLKWAWEHGADAWQKETLVDFANDPENLLASSAHENMSKGAKGVNEWLPKVNQDEYVTRFCHVVVKYELSFDGCN